MPLGAMEPWLGAPGPGMAPAESRATAPSTPHSPAAEAGSGTFHNVIYTPPPGWTVNENSAGAVVSPQGQMQGEESLDLVILPGKTGSDLEQEFQTTWNEVCGMLNAQSMRTVNGSMYDTEGVQRSWNGWDYMRGEGGAFNNQIRYTLGRFLVKVNGRIERVAIVSQPPSHRDTPQHMSIFSSFIDIFPRHVASIDITCSHVDKTDKFEHDG